MNSGQFIATAIVAATVAAAGAFAQSSATLEKEAEKTVAVAGPNTEIDKDGNVTRKVNRFAQSLKWLFLTLVAIIALILLIRFK